MAKDVTMADRFRGFLPVVVDVETGGFNASTDALLEIAAVLLRFDEQGLLCREETFRYHIKPFEGANLDPASLAVNGIDPDHPLRPAIDERDALQRVFRDVRRAIREANCTRAILVGHNSAFDLGFLNAAIERCAIKRIDQAIAIGPKDWHLACGCHKRCLEVCSAFIFSGGLGEARREAHCAASSYG